MDRISIMYVAGGVDLRVVDRISIMNGAEAVDLGTCGLWTDLWSVDSQCLFYVHNIYTEVMYFQCHDLYYSLVPTETTIISYQLSLSKHEWQLSSN